MNKSAKYILKQNEITLFCEQDTNTSPLLNYASLVKKFDCDEEYPRVFRCIKHDGKEKNKKTELLYQEIFKLISSSSPAVKYSFKFAIYPLDCNYEKHKNLYYSKLLGFFSFTKNYLDLDVLSISNGTSSDHLNHISLYCKSIKSLEIVFRNDFDCDNSFELNNLISKLNEIYSLKLTSMPEDFHSKNIKNIFTAIESKISLIKELKIDYSENISVKMLSKFTNLKKIKITLTRKQKYLEILELIDPTNFKSLEIFNLTISNVKIDIDDIIRNKKPKIEESKFTIAKRKHSANYLNLLESIIDEKGQPNYLEIILSRKNNNFIPSFVICNNFVQANIFVFNNIEENNCQIQSYKIYSWKNLNKIKNAKLV